MSFLQRVNPTSGGPKQRCIIRGCNKWEFANGLCKECAKDAAPIAHLLNRNWEEYKNKPPIAVNMVVVQERSEGHFIELHEGDYVHVLEWCASEKDLCIVRSAREEIGYFATSALKTETQIYEEFTMEEDVQLILELEKKNEVEREQEAQFEAALKQKMRDKAEQDRLQRQAEAEARKAEAERLLAELEAQKAYEAEQARIAQEEKRMKMARDAEERKWRDAQLRKQANAVREADERAFQARMDSKAAASAAWERAEAERKDKEYLDSLPAWKRVVILRKREQEKMAQIRS